MVGDIVGGLGEGYRGGRGYQCGRGGWGRWEAGYTRNQVPSFLYQPQGKATFH